jgi:hypothetical protein
METGCSLLCCRWMFCILQVPTADLLLDAMILRLHNEARAWPPLVEGLRQVSRLLEVVQVEVC